MKFKTLAIVLSILFLLQSCASKEDVYYFQDARIYADETIRYGVAKVQPNDILNITVSALIPETAAPYNVKPPTENPNLSLELLQLQGYLVSTEGTIFFPVLGRLEVAGKSPRDVERKLEQLLEEGGHLNEPTVNVRLLNAKVTILGEVKAPGTYSFTEQNISLPQALGYAGDLTINGKRDDILLIREENGVRKITHVDLTSASWFDRPEYYVKPNDVIVVNPNDAKVKSAGLIGNVGTV
ncbi:MAG: ligand-binding protein, partial [Flavobacteriaceae bacterium]|nr:ligand-binding protein [Flavobacteriaceae bacterium]